MRAFCPPKNTPEKDLVMTPEYLAKDIIEHLKDNPFGENNIYSFSKPTNYFFKFKLKGKSNYNFKSILCTMEKRYKI